MINNEIETIITFPNGYPKINYEFIKKLDINKREYFNNIIFFTDNYKPDWSNGFIDGCNKFSDKLLNKFPDLTKNSIEIIVSYLSYSWK